MRPSGAGGTEAGTWIDAASGAAAQPIDAADLVTIVLAFLATLVGTIALRRVLIAASMMDIPNERSSHAAPVPRGGGVVFVVVALAAIASAIARGTLPAIDAAAAAGILAVAGIGFLDDRRSVGAAPRLAVHLGASAAAIWAATHGMPAFAPVAGGLSAPFAAAIVLALAVASAWCVNLVNFMDGIDGMAGFGGALILLSAAGIAAASGAATSPGPWTTVVAIAAAVAAFGVVNISPWRIFMGDAGSGALGLALAWALVSLVKTGALEPLAGLALPAVFVADATTTLAVRVARREHPARAHRTHAYQRLVRAAWTHRSVTAAYAAVHLLVVVPVAWHAQRGGAHAALAVVALYAMLALTALRLGAGREPAQPTNCPQAGA